MKKKVELVLEPIPKNAEVLASKDIEIKRLFLLRLHSEFKENKEIVEKYNKKFEANIKESDVDKELNNTENRYLIQQFRNNYLNKIKNVALANKRVRLDDLDYLRNRYLELIRGNMCIDKDERQEFRIMSRALIEVLGAARDEIEGKGITFNQMNVSMGEFDGKSDAELLARRQELIRQAEISLVGRASGANDNPEGIETAEIIQPA